MFESSVLTCREFWLENTRWMAPGGPGGPRIKNYKIIMTVIGINDY